MTRQLRDEGLVTFSGVTDRYAVAALAQQLMMIRPHRDAGPDGVTVITGARTAGPGYAAFTGSELIPHTDGSGVPAPPGLLLLTCVQPAAGGGATRLADGARIAATLAARHPDAFHALCAPQAALFGSASGYFGAVCEQAGPGRTSIRLRLDDLAWFSAGVIAAIPVLSSVISRHLQTFRLQAGQGLLLSNTRWLHGRDEYSGDRVMLRVLGDPLPGTGILPGFPSPPEAQTAQAGVMPADAPASTPSPS